MQHYHSYSYIKIYKLSPNGTTSDLILLILDNPNHLAVHLLMDCLFDKQKRFDIERVASSSSLQELMFASQVFLWNDAKRETLIDVCINQSFNTDSRLVYTPNI